MLKRALRVSVLMGIVFLLVHVSITAQQTATMRTILNNVWDKANHQLRTAPGVVAQGTTETEITILNDVWDSANNMLRTSGGGTGSGDFTTNTTTSVDGEAILFSGTTGKIGKRATGTGEALLNTGVLTAIPTASRPALNVKLPPYNAVGNGTTDDTTAIQTALNDAAVLNTQNPVDGAGIVYLPPGTYKITFITVPKVVLLEGSNMFQGTTLLQVNGVNGDAVRLKCSDTDAFFYGGIKHITVMKQAPVTDTLGSGIGVTRTSGTCSLGETARVSDIYVHGFPVSGIQIREGSAPLRITHISAFHNGQFGVDLRGQHQTVLLDSISGDNNGTALINVDGTGSTYDATAIHISNVKAETKSGSTPPGGPQETVVVLKQLVNARVTIENISATKGGDGTILPQELVRLQGSRPIVTRLIDPACSGCVNMFVDETGPVTIPWGNEIHEIVYRESGVYQTISRNGYALRTITLGQNQGPVPFDWSGLFTQITDGNGVTLHTMKRATDTSPTGNFATYQNAAGTALWTVDINGTLTTGTVPLARTTGNLPVTQLNGGTGASGTTFWRGDGTWGTPAGGGGGTGDFSSNTAVSVDGEAVVFSGTTGKIGKRLTGTGIVSATSGVLSTSPAPAGDLVGTTATQTLTNKRINPRVVTLTDAATVTPNLDTTDIGILTSLSQATTIANPTGTLVDGQTFTLRIRSTTARALTWGTTYAVDTGQQLPATTTGASATDYYGFRYHSATGKLDLVAVRTGGAGTSTQADKQLFPAGVCRNGVGTSPWGWVSGGPSLFCVTSPTLVLNYADTGGVQTAEILTTLPSDATSSVTAKIYWSGESFTTTNAVVWQVAHACYGSGELPSFSAFETVTSNAVSPQFALAIASITLTTTGCAAGDSMGIQLRRDPSHANDTVSADAFFHSMELTVARQGP